MPFNKKQFNSKLRELELIEHIEGGMFKETARDSRLISLDPNEFPEIKGKYPAGKRCAYAKIDFALRPHDFSAFHIVRCDETWEFQFGASATIYMIDSKTGIVNQAVINSHHPVFVVPKNTWFAVEPEKEGGVIVTCETRPGFEYEDFALADRKMLLEKFPEHSELITRLTQCHQLAFV